MFVQYYIIDRSLSMRQGKACAQCAHGALIMHDAVQTRGQENLKKAIERGAPGLTIEAKNYMRWRGDGQMKVVLKGTPEDLERALAEIKGTIEVRDAGHTEVEANTRTVVVLPILTKDGAPDWIKEMKLL